MSPEESTLKDNKPTDFIREAVAEDLKNGRFKYVRTRLPPEPNGYLHIGHVKAFMIDFRTAFPDLHVWGTADLIAEGDSVVGRWEGGGTHTGPAFRDFLLGALPAATGRQMHFTGMTVLRLQDGKIVEEIGLDDGVTALQQLGLITAVQ